ncbi:hypothetical protein E2C01_027582 [Portunus trituberculatus]|uniref:Uncharacterized protein n=1 Tax=Portunus trituberculatus TaxID=210409 RepID=A0A5B7EJ39_PORTR|nr:hypothetical protein [Portunus trituberculatus]
MFPPRPQGERVAERRGGVAMGGGRCSRSCSIMYMIRAFPSHISPYGPPGRSVSPVIGHGTACYLSTLLWRRCDAGVAARGDEGGRRCARCGQVWRGCVGYSSGTFYFYFPLPRRAAAEPPPAAAVTVTSGHYRGGESPRGITVPHPGLRCTLHSTLPLVSREGECCSSGVAGSAHCTVPRVAP